jgi:hypothetical protein
MLKSTFFPFNGHFEILELYYPMSVLRSPLWKSCDTILFSFIGFFDGSPTQVQVCHIFNRCSLRHYMNMSPILCRSNHRCLVISLPCHICILFVLGSLLHNIMYPLWFLTSNNCTSFMLSVWTYHCWFNYPFVSMPMWEWTHNNPWYSSKYCHNYCCGKWNTSIDKGFPPFPPPHLRTSWYSYH